MKKNGYNFSLRLSQYAIAICVFAQLSGCGLAGKMFGGKDNAEKPAELVAFNPAFEPKKTWQANVGASGDYVFVPALHNENVYAAARDGTLARFDAAGRQVWRNTGKHKLSAGVGVGSNLVLLGTQGGEVVAYDLDGQLKWETPLNVEILSAPQAADGIVVVRSGDGRIFGLDAQNGKRKWTYSRSTPALVLRSHAGLVISNGTAYAGFAGGKIVALDLANGNVRWEASVALPKGATELERIADITSLPVIDGQFLYVVSYQGRIACFETSNGNVVWAREMSSVSGLGVDANYVYVSDARGAVHALDKGNGASLWKQSKLFARQLSAPVAINRYVAVGDLQGFVHFLSREDGSFAARTPTDGSRISATPINLTTGERQSLLVQTRNGTLTAIAP